MVQIMREVRRRTKRTWLAEAKVVGIALDDRKNYQLISFTCDIGLAPPQACTELGSRSGIIGVINSTTDMEEKDWDDDYAERVTAKVCAAICLFYTGLDGSTDELEVRAFRLKVLQLTADMALMKTVHLVREELFPNLTVYHRDPSHAIRLACKQPLERAGMFEGLFHLLFHDNHAMLKDLRYSDLWAAKVQDCMRQIVQDRGFLGGDITQITRTFTFAPQRFEYVCTPLFNLPMVIPAVIKMLKMIASYKRDDSQAKRAFSALRQINGQFILDLGIAADYGSICLALLRKFDVHSKDPSTTRQLLRHWEHQLDTLFCEGNIFRDASSAVAGEKTATQIAMEQIDYISEVDYRGRVQDFLAVSPKDLFARGMREMHAAVPAAKARMTA